MWKIIGTAVLVGFVSFFEFWLVQRPRATFILPWRYGDELNYAAKIRQIKLNILPFNPYYSGERSAWHTIQDAANYYVTYYLTFPFDDIGKDWARGTAIALGGLFIALVAFLKKPNIPSENLIFVALLVIVTADVWQANAYFHPREALRILTDGDLSNARALQFEHLTSPGLSSIFLLGWLWLFIEDSPWAIVAGIGLFFVHFYDWTFALMATIVAGRWKPAFIMGTVLAGLCLIASHGIDSSVLLRANFRWGYQFIPAAVIPIVFIPVLWYFESPLLCPFIAGIILLNLDLVTRFSIQKTEWFKETNFVLELFFAGLLLEYLPKMKWVYLSPLLLLLVSEVRCSEKWKDTSRMPLFYQRKIDYINEHLPVDALILSMRSDVNHIIPAYTHATAQVGHAAPLINTASEDEQIIRLCSLLKTLHVTPKRFFQLYWSQGWNTDVLDSHYLYNLPYQKAYAEVLVHHYWKEAPILKNYYLWSHL